MTPRSVRRCFSFAICLLLSGAVRAESERLDIDPVVQGLWKVHATSTDKGTTIKYIQPAETLCRVGPTKVRFANGQEQRVEKVMISKDAQGNPMNLVRFDTGLIWGISKERGNPFILVQVFGGIELKETLRVLVTVDQ